MAKISCFSALLSCKNKKSKKAVSYAKRGNINDWQNVMSIRKDKSCSWDTEVVAGTYAELACQGRDDKAPATRDVLSDVDLVGCLATVSSGYKSDGYTSAAEGKGKEIAAVVEEPTVHNQWVSSSLIHADEEGGIRIAEIGESSGTNGHARMRQNRRNKANEEAVQQASSSVQTLNISGMGLEAVPMISAFSRLRAVNLSSNFIAHISPGSLPKGLHSLDLSRNNIATIEGLWELTRLRVLNLSYNRISRIGHGLSNCTAIRELYLAGNKISDVDGLHRLVKLAVLDLSFSKITTAKGLAQLVSNYNSLRAINLLGNPVQTNVGDDKLHKTVSGLLPRLEYINKQAIKKGALGIGNNRFSSRRCASTERLIQSTGSLANGRNREGRSRSRSQNRDHAWWKQEGCSRSRSQSRDQARR